MRRRGAAALATAVLAAAVTGCGALPPEAPIPVAGDVSRALTTIASSCGESYRLQEFTPHPDLRALEATASDSAGTLARLAARHPEWVYQSQTLAQLKALSVTALQSCALPRAAAVLRRGAS